MFQFTYSNISQPFDYLYTLIMNGLIDTTAPYVNIFICYGQQLKYLLSFFLLHPRNSVPCYELIIILFSTDWTMAGMKTLIIIFVIMFPVAMITQEDVNHGGNNQQLRYHQQKFNCAPAVCRHYISASCLCFMYREPLKILIFTFPKKLFQGFIRHNFHIVNNTPCLPPKFCMRIVFNFSLE